MPKTPTIPEILEAFEAEIARAPRWCSVDRHLLAKVIVEVRRRVDLTPSEAQLCLDAIDCYMDEHGYNEPPLVLAMVTADKLRKVGV